MMRYLESLLTRVTMYALTFGTLTVLICQAAIMPFFNAVSFTPFELAASSAVFIGVSIGVSYLLAQIYGLRSHISSAYITALILILLCTPTLDGITLLEYALIATIAQASKGHWHTKDAISLTQQLLVYLSADYWKLVMLRGGLAVRHLYGQWP